MSRDDVARALAVSLLCLGAYLLTANGRIVHRDGEAVYQVARSLLDRGAFDVPVASVFLQYEGPGTQGGSKLDIAQNTAALGPDGRAYAKYGVGLSIASIPFLVAARLAGPLFPAVPDVVLERAAVPLVNALATALTAGLLVLVSAALGYPRRPAVAAGFLFGLATFAWPHARNYYGEPLAGLLLLLAFGLLLAQTAFRHALPARSPAALYTLAGAAAGAAILVRPTAAVAVLPLIGLALTSRGKQSWVSAIAWLGLPVAAALGLTALYNLLRFGSPLDFGYRGDGFGTLLPVGLFGLLLSPGKGVLWYAPPLVLALVGWWRWLRDPAFRPLMVWPALAVLGWIGFHGVFDFWEGGWTWGPRLLLPILPLVLLPVGQALPQPGSWLARQAVALVVAIGFLTQLPPAFSDYTRYYWATHLNHGAAGYEVLIYQPAGSPVIRQFGMLAEVLLASSEPGRLDRLRSETAAAVATMARLAPDERSVALLDRSALLGINTVDNWLLHLWLFGAQPASLAALAAPGVAAIAFGLALLSRRARRQQPSAIAPPGSAGTTSPPG